MHSCNQILPWERPSPADHLPATRPLHLCYVTHSLSISFLLSAYLFPLFFYSSSFKQQLTTTDKRRVSITVEQQTNSTNRQTQCDAMQRTESKPLKGCPSPGPKPFPPDTFLSSIVLLHPTKAIRPHIADDTTKQQAEIIWHSNLQIIASYFFYKEDKPWKSEKH